MMIEISFVTGQCVVAAAWIVFRAAAYLKNKKIDWRFEGIQLLFLINLLVIYRITFHPFAKLGGQVQPLLFDVSRIFPPRINLLPIVYLFDYPVFREALVNLIGNTAMFLPLGIVWPSVFRQLDTHGKVIAAGAGYSLLIEIVQLPFFDRVTDIDDLILNSLGFLAGYGIYLLARAVNRICKRRRGRK